MQWVDGGTRNFWDTIQNEFSLITSLTRSRFLVDGGNVVPSSANYFIAPIQSSFISRYSVFEGDKAGGVNDGIFLVWDFGDNMCQKSTLGDILKITLLPSTPSNIDQPFSSDKSRQKL